MKEDEYNEAKIKRLDILIENIDPLGAPPSKELREYYNEIRLIFLKKLPKKIIKQKKEEIDVSLTELDNDFDHINENDIYSEALTLKEELAAKRQKLLEDLEELEKLEESRKAKKNKKEKVICNICGELLLDPLSDSHLNSKVHKKYIENI